MPRKTDDTPALVTKKAAAAKVVAKRPVGRPKKDATAVTPIAPKRRGRPPKAVAKTPIKKTIPAVKTPSLVNAKPLSSISPTNPNPEQLLYESDILSEPIRAPKTAQNQAAGAVPEPAAAAPKRRPGRPKVIKPEAAESSAPNSKPMPEPKTASPKRVVTAPEARVVSEAPSVRMQRRRRRIRKFAFAAVAVVVLFASWYFGLHRSPNVEAENNQLLAQISKRAVLPSDETPSISTVVDPTKVNQQFLKNAQKGDKVLLYFQSGQAVVYRPSTGQIVNMGPLETPKPRVFIRQGSSTNNVGAVQGIISKTSDFILASQDQSANKTYTKTVVVDLTGNRPDLAGKLAQLLHVQVAQLPAGEDRPDADLMVIVGSDFK